MWVQDDEISAYSHVLVTQVLEDDEYSAEELDRDYAFFVQPSEQTGDAATLQSKVAQLEAEVALLKDELGKAKGVNDMMWETVVQRVVNIKEKDRKGMDVDG
jgi:pre-rRNA-processing protein IPI3